MTAADAARARALHSRRALARAIEHGDALLDVLGLPPTALAALDAAIAALDEFDAPAEDLEDDGLAEAEPDDEDDGTAEDEPDLEAVNEDGDPLDFGEREDEGGDASDCDPHWWERPAHPPSGIGSHI